MFVQISNSRLRKKKQTHSDGEEEDSEKRDEEVEVADSKEGPSFTDVDLGNETKTEGKVVGKESMLSRISVKAAKMKKDSIGRLFGEKENIRVYTIDQEMKHSRHEPINLGRAGHPEMVERGLTGWRDARPSHPELSDRLQRTRQPAPSPGPTERPLGIQATPFPPYRLHFLPSPTWNDPEDRLATVLRAVTCQLALILFIIIWVIFGALTLFLVEGTSELEYVHNFVNEEESLVYSEGTDLRMLTPNSTQWLPTIAKYSGRHKKAMRLLADMGYTDRGLVWTYAGSFLIATNLIITAGVGLPLPGSTGGTVSAIIYTLIGLPIHWILLWNSGLCLAVKIQSLAKDVDTRLQALKRRIQNLRKYGEERQEREAWPSGLFEGEFRPPCWLRWTCISFLPLHYLTGMVLLAAARGRTTATQLLFFPWDLSQCLPLTEPFTRIAFAFYLEVAAVLLALTIALLRVPTPTSAMDSLIAMGIVTNSVD